MRHITATGIKGIQNILIKTYPDNTNYSDWTGRYHQWKSIFDEITNELQKLNPKFKRVIFKYEILERLGIVS
jgi:hypothetical protein